MVGRTDKQSVVVMAVVIVVVMVVVMVLVIVVVMVVVVMVVPNRLRRHTRPTKVLAIANQV